MRERVHESGQGGAFGPDVFHSVYGDRPAIRDVIRAAADADGILADSAMTLPDESLDDGNLHWAAGALDGVTTHHMLGAEGSSDRLKAQTLRSLIDRVATERRVDDVRMLYSHLVERGFVANADALAESFGVLPPRDTAVYADLARTLVRSAPDREPVKLGIMLLGHVGDVDDHTDLLTLGSHDEFTLFALIALSHLNVDDAAWTLARRVKGWGRIHCIERLDAPIADPALRRWLVTEGWRNSIMPEYTAAICARRGQLLEELTVADDAVIDGAAGILAALCREGGPGEDFRGYRQCFPACEALLSLIENHADPKVEWLIALRDTTHFADRMLKVDVKTAGAARDLGWTPQGCRALMQGYQRVIAQSQWRDRIARVLKADDEAAFRKAAEIAPAVGIDPFEARFTRVQRGEDHWYWLVQTRDAERFDRVLEFARESIDLKAIATGPSDSPGFGPAFALHRTLDWILQELRRWPGKGGDFIRAALMSPVVRNRVGAARALLAWTPEARTDYLADVSRARALDPDEACVEILDQVLCGTHEPDA